MFASHDLSGWFLSLGILGIMLCVLGLMLWLSPIVVAVVRGHPNTASICVVTILLGWSLIGLAVALAWAFTAFEPKPRAQVRRQRSYESSGGNDGGDFNFGD